MNIRLSWLWRKPTPEPEPDPELEAARKQAADYRAQVDRIVQRARRVIGDV